MKTLYFLAPDATAAKRLVEALLLARVDSRRIAVYGRSSPELARLPEARVIDLREDAGPDQRAVAMGGTAGILAAALGLGLRVVNPPLAFGVFLATTLAGAAFGAAGQHAQRNTVRERYARDIGEGALAVCVTVPAARVEQIRAVATTSLAFPHGAPDDAGAGEIARGI